MTHSIANSKRPVHQPHQQTLAHTPHLTHDHINQSPPTLQPPINHNQQLTPPLHQLFVNNQNGQSISHINKPSHIPPTSHTITSINRRPHAATHQTQPTTHPTPSPIICKQFKTASPSATSTNPRTYPPPHTRSHQSIAAHIAATHQPHNQQLTPPLHQLFVNSLGKTRLSMSARR